MTASKALSFRPLALLAELTWTCPLHCPYCANPVGFAAGTELTAAEWQRVLNEAAEMGVIHVGLSGGEPLLRVDLCEIIANARSAGLYTNLISSGIGMTDQLASDLKSAGLDSFQLSFQSDEAELGDTIAGAHAHKRKLDCVRMLSRQYLPLSVNVVLHRLNIERVEGIIALAERLGAHRLELAHTQFYGWALRNRAALLPTRQQIEHAHELAERHAARLQDRIKIVYVAPDYFSDRPKACMNGWGRTHITVNPVGAVLPCPNASDIPGVKFENVRDNRLADIWHNSAVFQQFRGTDWMLEPCRSCEHRESDFGGCRCQAALLTGNAHATDPACSLSPFRNLLDQALAEKPNGKWVYRENPGPAYRQV